eukprot:758309-Prymnesium_polylepis.1
MHAYIHCDCVRPRSALARSAPPPPPARAARPRRHGHVWQGVEPYRLWLRPKTRRKSPSGRRPRAEEECDGLVHETDGGGCKRGEAISCAGSR